MQSKIIIVALATTAAAQLHQLLPRQTGPISAIPSACISALKNLEASAPQPPQSLITGLPQELDIDPCSFKPPASLSSAWNSYTNAVVSWARGHTSEINAVISACPQASGSPNGGIIDCKASTKPATAQSTGGAKPTGTDASKPASTNGSTAPEKTTDGSTKPSNTPAPSGDGKSGAASHGIAMGAVLGAGLVGVLAL